MAQRQKQQQQQHGQGCEWKQGENSQQDEQRPPRNSFIAGGRLDAARQDDGDGVFGGATGACARWS